MKNDVLLNFERYLQKLSKSEYDALLEKAFYIAIHILKDKKQLTS